MAGRAAAAAGRPIAARPVLSTSLAVFAAFFGVVATNALHAQGGRHPHPLLTTRPVDPAALADIAGEDGAGSMPVPLVAEVQGALADAGYYDAPVDGRPGPRTSAAIRSFQGDNGLAVDGEATPKLLAALHGITEERQALAGRGQRVASLDPQETGTTNDGGPSTAPPSVASRAPDRELVRRIQEGLTAARVAELHADGIMGSRTEAAIRTFQASQGLDVTGRPEEAVLARLRAIGAPKR